MTLRRPPRATRRRRTGPSTSSWRRGASTERADPSIGAGKGANLSPPPRRPAATLVVDAKILLSAVLGRRSEPLFRAVAEIHTAVTSIRAAEEVRGVLSGRSGLPLDARARAEALLAGIGVIEEALYAGRLDDAARVLTRAVASRNGSSADAHLLACAWVFDADLWSHDRDFAGTGWPSWSNANLSEALEPARA